jgi:hypothetical protein
MEVGQGPNWGCSAKGKKNSLHELLCRVTVGDVAVFSGDVANFSEVHSASIIMV